MPLNNEQIQMGVKDNTTKWKPYHFPLLLIGITPNTPKTWRKGKKEKISIILVSLFVSFFTIFIPSMIVLGLSIEVSCVPGNKDFEDGSGICAGNGRKDKEQRKQREERLRLGEEHSKQYEAEQKANEWYNEVSPYSCERTLKENLRNPGSYERAGDFIITADNGTQKTIIWKFRAQNGFGGMNISAATCNISKRNGGEYEVKQISE